MVSFEDLTNLANKFNIQMDDIDVQSTSIYKSYNFKLTRRAINANYKINITCYNDTPNKVNIFIMRNIKDMCQLKGIDGYTILKKLNALNIKYTDIKFSSANNLIIMSTICNSLDHTDNYYDTIMYCLEVASEELKSFNMGIAI